MIVENVLKNIFSLILGVSCTFIIIIMIFLSVIWLQNHNAKIHITNMITNWAISKCATTNKFVPWDRIIKSRVVCRRWKLNFFLLRWWACNLNIEEVCLYTFFCSSAIDIETKKINKMKFIFKNKTFSPSLRRRYETWWKFL